MKGVQSLCSGSPGAGGSHPALTLQAPREIHREYLVFSCFIESVPMEDSRTADGSVWTGQGSPGTEQPGCREDPVLIDTHSKT